MFRKIQLIGNVGKDPEIKNTPNGKMATFSMAVNEPFTQNGEKKQKTSWFNLVAFQSKDTGLVTGLIGPHIRKGTMLFVDGTPNNRQWTDQSGNKRYSFEVVLDFNSTIKLLSNGKSHGGEKSGDGGEAPGEAAGGSSTAGLDDDIPF